MALNDLSWNTDQGVYNMPTSVQVEKPMHAMKVKGLWPSRGGHWHPDQTFCEVSTVERACWDLKDGELCWNRVKPEETLVEAHSILMCKSIVKFAL